jgi:hypothetical protein
MLSRAAIAEAGVEIDAYQAHLDETFEDHLKKKEEEEELRRLRDSLQKMARMADGLLSNKCDTPQEPPKPTEGQPESVHRTAHRTRGPKPRKRARAMQAMEAIPQKELSAMLVKEMTAKFGHIAGPTTLSAARRAVLPKTN